MTPLALPPPKRKRIIHSMNKECATCLYWETEKASIRSWGECLVTTTVTHRNSDCVRWKMVHMTVRGNRKK